MGLFSIYSTSIHWVCSKERSILERGFVSFRPSANFDWIYSRHCCLIVVWFVSFAPCYVLITRFRLAIIRYMFVFLSCMFWFLFCVFCIPVFVVSPHVHSWFFSIRVQIYWPLPPGGKPIAVNDYHDIISHHITPYFSFSIAWAWIIVSGLKGRTQVEGVSRDSSVGTETRYGLEGPRI
jgi:hypothetical protein